MTGGRIKKVEMGWEGGTYREKRQMFIASGQGKMQEKGDLDTYAWTGR